MPHIIMNGRHKSKCVDAHFFPDEHTRRGRTIFSNEHTGWGRTINKDEHTAWRGDAQVTKTKKHNFGTFRALYIINS